MNTINYIGLPTLAEFYSHKYVRHTEWKYLVLFHYTDGCTYDKAWDKVTLNARGIIFNKATGEVVARVWRKFFNLSEMSTAIPQNNFYTLTKLDGSMGTLFNYENEYYIATKGSFTSEQAIWATGWARKNINFYGVNDEYTYIFEIIYKNNKIVVDYKDFEGLVLTGVINKKDGKEMDPHNLNDFANLLNISCAKEHFFKSLDELASYCKTLPSSEEGFVVTFPSTGLKVKIKGNEYLRIHKIISNLTALAFYEAWSVKERKIPEFYLQQVPEEFRKFTDEMSGVINKIHQDLFIDMKHEYNKIMSQFTVQPNIKDFAIECQNNYKKNMSLLINMFKNQEDMLWENIHKRVRPNGNILPAGYGVECDIHGRVSRVLDDGQ